MRRSEIPASAVSAIGQIIEREGQRLAVKIAAGNNFFADDQRIVGDRVQFDRENPPGLGQRVAHRAMHLRRAAQRIGVLHFAAG